MDDAGDVGILAVRLFGRGVLFDFALGPPSFFFLLLGTLVQLSAALHLRLFRSTGNGGLSFCKG